MSSDLQKLKENIFSGSKIQVLNYIFPIITLPLITRVIGPDNYGKINYILGIVTYFMMIIGFGFEISATRKIDFSKKDKLNIQNNFNQVFFSQFLLFTLCLFAYFILVMCYEELKNELLISIFTFLNCLSVVFTQDWLFQANQKLNVIFRITFLSKCIFLLLVVLLIREEKDYVLVPFLVGSQLLISSIVSFLYAINYFKIKLVLPSLKSIKSTLNESLTFFLSSIVISLYTTTPLLFLGILHSSLEVGFFSAGYKLIAVVNGFMTMILTKVFYPYIVIKTKKGIKKSIQHIRKLIPIIFYLMLTSSVFIFFFSELIVALVFGKDFLESAKVLKSLSLLPLILSISSILGIHVYINLGFDNLFMKITKYGATVGLPIIFVSTYFYSYIGASISLVVVEGIVCFLFFYFLKTKKRIQVIDYSLFKPKLIIKYINIFFSLK